MRISEGGCLCGRIRYRVLGESIDSTICHCRTCRRGAGAPAVAWVTFPKDKFQLTDGNPVEFRSTPPVRRTFCGACGTPLTYEHQDVAGSIDVTTCTLDDPNAFPPTHHSWTSHDLEWLRFFDSLPSYPESKAVAAPISSKKSKT